MRFSRRWLWRQSGAAALMVIACDPSSAADATVQCQGDERVCETVTAGERELTSVLVSGDVRVIARLFADDAVWSLGNGVRWTKGEAIAALRNAPKMTSSRLLWADVRQFGTTAIVLWKEGWRDSATGRDAQSFGTDTWILRAGRWQIVASQEGRAPTKPAP